MATSETLSQIGEMVKAEKVVLFMKGSRSAPQCGFSATVVGLLDQYLPEYKTVDVLADQAIREGIKEFANWPTIPQLYVDGEFVGGCDIIRELESQGELFSTLGDAAQLPEPPDLTVTDEAAKVFGDAQKDASDGEMLRLSISPQYQHDLVLEAKGPTDIEVEANGIKLIIDPGSARRANGTTIDYVTEPSPGFKINNPNAPATVQQLTPSEAKALLAEHDDARFIDVRTPGERETAMIEGTTLLSNANISEIVNLPKMTPLVFHCHHGQRSQQAAMHFLQQGFKRVYNLAGGIDAWSMEVDASVPRY